MPFDSGFAPLRFIIPIRDMLQSIYGGKVAHNSGEILSFYNRLKEFNEAGPVKIAGVEGHGGALPQYDVNNGRYPLAISEDVTDALDESFVQRPLIRGPFGVTLSPQSKEDLKHILREMAEAGGAKNGHKVVFKLFEAQNRPVEYLDSLKIISELKAEGYNVACEVAMVVSDKPGLDMRYYARVAESLLDAALFKREGIDPTIIEGFSIKDMIGKIKARQEEWQDDMAINAKNLTLVAMNAIQYFSHATGQKLYFGAHTHEIGNAIGYLAEIARTYDELRHFYPGVSELQLDALMGSPDPTVIKNFGFADLELLLESLEGVTPNMSDKQKAIWADMKQLMLQLHNRYSHAYIDASKWSKEQLEYGELASGGVPDAEGFIEKCFLDRIAAMTTSDGVVIGKEKAHEISRCLFASINGLLSNDLGCAHSVTPAMKLLNKLTVNVGMALLDNPDFAQRYLHPDAQWNGVLKGDADKDLFRKHYEAFADVEAMAYFCTPMPTEVPEGLLGLMRRKLFWAYFKDYEALQTELESNSATMLKGLSKERYNNLRAELAGHLLDKKAVVKLLVQYGIPREKAKAFAASHIGINECPVNHGVKPRRERIRSSVAAFIKKTGGHILVRAGLKPGVDALRYIVFSAMIMKPRPGEAIALPVTKLARQTPFRSAGVPSWQEFITGLNRPRVYEGAGSTEHPKRATRKQQQAAYIPELQ